MEIQYKVKQQNEHTKINTTYVLLQPGDKRAIMNMMRDVLDVIDLLRESDNQKEKNVLYRLIRPTDKIPVQGNCQKNSIFSAFEGIIDNIENGTQRDFSTKTLKLIETAFDELQSILPYWENIRFVEVNEFVDDEYKSTTKSTFSDLFEIDNITITYKKK